MAGNEGAGTVVSAGEGVEDLQPGDRVAWSQTLGSAARFAALPASALVPVPEGIDLETAAAVMLQGLTAHYLTTSTYAVQPGDVALVHAAAGGVGQLLVQMVRARGGSVVATAGGPDKCDTARGLGAEHVIDYRAVDDLAGEVRRLTDGRGGRRRLRRRRQGHLRRVAGVAEAPRDARPVRRRQRPGAALRHPAAQRGGSLFLTRPTLGHHLATREELLWRAGEVLGAVADGTPARRDRWPLPAHRGRDGVRRPRGPAHPGQAAPHPLTRTPTSCDLGHGSRPRMPCDNRAQVARGRGWAGRAWTRVRWRWSRGRRWRR